MSKFRKEYHEYFKKLEIIQNLIASSDYQYYLDYANAFMERLLEISIDYLEANTEYRKYKESLMEWQKSLIPETQKPQESPQEDISKLLEAFQNPEEIVKIMNTIPQDNTFDDINKLMSDFQKMTQDLDKNLKSQNRAQRRFKNKNKKYK
jgi:hypothetical protein